MREDKLSPRVASTANWTDADRRTLRMGLVEWQRSLMRAPDLLATPAGLAEWERIGMLLEALK